MKTLCFYAAALCLELVYTPQLYKIKLLIAALLNVYLFRMIFFDIDDTLFDNSGAEIRAAKRFYGKKPGLEHFADQNDFVGDKLETDATAAGRAGLTGIWLNRHGLNYEQNDICEIYTLDAFQGGSKDFAYVEGLAQKYQKDL